MSASGARLVILVLGVAVAVFVAIRLADSAFGERKDIQKDLDSGKLADRRDTAAKPPLEPPLVRPTGAQDEVLVVDAAFPAATRPTDRRRHVVLKGNGVLKRLPAAADETGPLVTAALDRGDVDALIRRALALPASAEGPFRITVRTGAGTETRNATPTDAAVYLKAVGRAVKRGAAPESLRIRITPAASLPTPPTGPTPPPLWPLPRQRPDAFIDGAQVDVAADRLRESVKTFAVGAMFRDADGVIYAVTDADVLP